MGGIGHYGIIFANALGAETWAISRTHAKEEDMKTLGAKGFIATSDKDWGKKPSLPTATPLYRPLY